MKFHAAMQKCRQQEAGKQTLTLADSFALPLTAV